MSDVVWMTAKFQEVKPREICHPNYIMSYLQIHYRTFTVGPVDSEEPRLKTHCCGLKYTARCCFSRQAFVVLI